MDRIKLSVLQKIKYCSIIITVPIFFYLPVIFLFPSFIEDDFAIFNIIKENLNYPITFDLHSPFQLFFRPLTYFSFWIDYNLFNDNFILIKLHSLLLLISNIFVLYFLVKKISQMFNYKFDCKIFALLIIIYIVHIENIINILWIANRNELLSLLFYSISFMFVIKFIELKKGKYIVGYNVFYLLSIMAKQQGLHLPILVIFLLFYYKRTLNNNFSLTKVHKFLFFISLLIMFVGFYINSVINTNDTMREILFSNLWKKPLAMIGVVVNILLPYGGQTVYGYFILHKWLAFLMLFAVLVFGVILILNKKLSIKTIIFFFLFFVIIFIPRISVAGSIRLNSIILFWVIIFAYFLISNRDIRYKNSIMAFITVLFILFGIYKIVTAYAININNSKKLIYLDKIIVQNKNSKFIIFVNTFDIKYSYYYFKNNRFGIDKRIISSPIFYPDIIFYSENYNPKQKIMNVSISNDILIVKCLVDYLYYEPVDSKYFDVVDKVSSPSGRGYSEIKFKLTQKYLYEKPLIVYNNGTNWQVVN